MPASPGAVTVSVQRATVREFLRGIPVIVAYDSTFGTANEVRSYSSAAGVEADHGAATKTTAAAKALFLNRARKCIIVKPAKTTVVAENFAGTGTSGTLANANITRTATVAARVDAVAKTVVFVFTTPIGVVPVGEVHINPKTGAWKSGDVPVTNVEFDYSFFDYLAAAKALNSVKDEHGPYTFTILPGLEADVDSFGDYSGLKVQNETNDWFTIAHLPKEETVANGKLFRESIDSSHLALVAHKDDGDVAALVTGTASRNAPWNSMAYKRIRGLDPDGFYLDTQIGDVETADTFEGEGINVVHRYAGTLTLSNWRTAVEYTDASDEIYGDRVLTRIFLQKKLDVEIAALVVNVPKIGFDVRGVAAVSGVMMKVFENLVTEQAIFGQSAPDPDDRPAIVEPDLLTIPASQEKARDLGPFIGTVTMIEAAHKITIEITLEVA